MVNKTIKKNTMKTKTTKLYKLKTVDEILTLKFEIYLYTSLIDYYDTHNKQFLYYMFPVTKIK